MHSLNGMTSERAPHQFSDGCQSITPSTEKFNWALEQLKEKLKLNGYKFSLNAIKEIIDTILAHGSADAYIDLKDRLHNRFFHEIHPIVGIVDSLECANCQIELTGTHQRYDGLIILGEEDRQQRVEITTAIDSHNDALMMELVEKEGHAPAFVKIVVNGNKNKREFGQNQLSSFKKKEYFCETLFPLLENALKRKLNKAKENLDYVDGWLGIVFDDWLVPQEDAKITDFDPLCSQLLRDGVNSYTPFTRVFVVGISGKYLFDSEQGPRSR